MATIFRANGDIEIIQPTAGKFTLEEMQKIVGGYIEIIRTDIYAMVMNEEGRLKKLPTNENATQIIRAHAQWRHIDRIVGDALVCTYVEAGFQNLTPDP